MRGRDTLGQLVTMCGGLTEDIKSAFALSAYNASSLDFSAMIQLPIGDNLEVSWVTFEEFVN